MNVTEPGIYELTEAEYHADPCEPFSLSRGVAHLLLTGNPKKAHRASRKLGGKRDIIPNRAMDAGSAVHSLMLGRGADIEVMSTTYGDKHKKAGQPVTDFATDAAKHERDLIRSYGRIPVLAHQMPMLHACRDAAFEQMHEHEDGAAFFAPGRSEAVVIWQEDGLWFRIMVDRLPDDPHAMPYDIKATEMLAAPGKWDRRLQTIYAFQDAFYRRGLKAVRGVMPAPFRFPVVELDEPYCLAMHAAAPSLQAMAEQEVERAIGIWRHCVKTNSWPAYPPFTAWVEAANWQINQIEEQMLRDEIMQEMAA
jgi:hypothetical protein